MAPCIPFLLGDREQPSFPAAELLVFFIAAWRLHHRLRVVSLTICETRSAILKRVRTER